MTSAGGVVDPGTSPTEPGVGVSGSPPPAPDAGATKWPLAKRVLIGVGLAVLVAGAAVGANVGGLRNWLTGSSLPPPAPVALSRVSGASPPASAPETVLRSQPWWQGVVALSGTGPSTQSVSIAAGALQWRINWSCHVGRLVIGDSGSSGSSSSKPLVSAPCAGSGSAYGVVTGPMKLAVMATGPWTAVVQQQLDVPLVQAPEPDMSASNLVASGTVYDVDQSGSGTASIYRLTTGPKASDDTYALRLAGFFVTPNVDLEIHLSPLAAPHSTKAYLAKPSAYVVDLDVTAGSLNFALPKGIDPSHYRSVVIWCQLLRSVYAAAALSSPHAHVAPTA